MTENKEDFKLQVFDGVHYDKWKFRLNLFLEMKECIEVLWSETRPESIKEDAWKKKEVKAKNYIVNSITNTQLELIISETSAKKMIEKLDEIYLVKNSAIKLLCKRKLLDLKMKENDNPTEFLNLFEKQINELKNAGEVVNNEDKLNYLLLALPESFSHIVDVIDALPDKEKSVEYVKSKLMIEYQKRESNSMFSGSQGSAQAFSAHRKFHNKKSYPQNKQWVSKSNPNERSGTSSKRENEKGYNTTPPKCFRCNKIGHLQWNCRTNMNWTRRSGKNVYNNERESSTKLAGSSVVEEEAEEYSFNVEVMLSKREKEKEVSESRGQSQQENIKWLLDSGCSDHIVNSDKYFSNSVQLKNPIDIKVGDGFSLKSNKIGTIQSYFNVNNNLVRVDIKNVYYVPSMKQNLLSVSCIVNQNYSIVFNKDSAKIYNNKNNFNC